MKRPIVLTGIDGSNPLGFLAALGCLRLLDHRYPHARLHWEMDGAWRPVLSGAGLDEGQLVEALLESPPIPVEVVSLLGKNLTVNPDTFRAFMRAAEESASGAGFAAAFGSEACEDKKKGRIEYTDFCFITGSGHQDFVETARKLIVATTASHLWRALFEPWRRADKGLSFRWDPADAVEYALRWDDPGPLGAWGDWGANRLAVEALPLLPVQPTGEGLATTGFRKDEFTWPLWMYPVSLGTVRSLLQSRLLQREGDAGDLFSMGVSQVFRARRVRIGQGANFKVSFRPARAI